MRLYTGSVSYSTSGPPDISPVGFTSQTFGGLVFMVCVPGAAGPIVEHQPLTPPEECLCGEPPLSCVSPHQGQAFYETVSLPLLPILTWSFFLLLWRVLHLVFRSLSERNDPYVALDLMFLWEEVSSGSSYAAMLDSPSPPSQRVFFN